MRHQRKGRKIQLGAYTLSIISLRPLVVGPSDAVASRTESRLQEHFLDPEFLIQLGQLQGGQSCSQKEIERARIAVCEKLGLPYGDACMAEETTMHSEPGLDYDDDQDLISRLRLPEVLDRRLKGLHGLFAGFLVDGSLDDCEIIHLYDWTVANPELLDRWPVSELNSLLKTVLADGVISDDERAQLRTFVESLADDFRMEGKPASTIFDENPSVEFTGKRFLLTGKLTMCKRKEAHQMLIARGGLVTKSPSSKLDYLVIGDEGNVNYQFARYGRKIEMVLDYKTEGHDICVLRESLFVAAL
jgi:hypothetical protein